MYLFIWLHQVLIVEHRILRIFSYSMQNLSCGMWELVTWPGIELAPPALGV